MDLDTLFAEIKAAKGFMVGITLLDKDDKLRHYFNTSNFPKVDILRSHSQVKELAIKELEGSSDITSGKFITGE